MSPNLSIKQHFYSKQNVQQNLRHKNVDFQCKSLQEIFVIVLILYPNLTFLAFRAYLLEPPPQDYIIKRKTIKNLNIKKCDKNYCTYSRIRIGKLARKHGANNNLRHRSCSLLKITVGIHAITFVVMIGMTIITCRLFCYIKSKVSVVKGLECCIG